MVLTVDVGNTNTVLGGFDGEELKFVSRIKTDKYKMPDEYAILFQQIISINGFSTKQFDGAIISSVVPPLHSTLKKAISTLLKCRVLTVSPGTKTGLNIRIDNPGILGADLVCSAVAAMNRYPMPCIIVDLGTATKFSVLDKDSYFLGVSIMPGVQISLDALSRNTAQLPHIDFENASVVIGTNSIDSMRSGIVFGTASMIDGMVERLNQEIGQEATVVITGGIATNIIPHCKTKMIVNPNLVLYGLNDIYHKNTKTK